ncbi:MAG: hypothetical protein ABEI31_04355 [Halodesulfurarchaeum sp.]
MSRGSGNPADRGIDLEHRIEVYPEGEECTLFPVDCDADALVTHWITAAEGDYVSLADMR